MLTIGIFFTLWAGPVSFIAEIADNESSQSMADAFGSTVEPWISLAVTFFCVWLIKLFINKYKNSNS